MQNSTLQFANNYEIVLAAIKNNDLALDDASADASSVASDNVSEELKDDISKCGLSFKYTS